MEALVSAVGNAFVLQSDLIAATCIHRFRDWLLNSVHFQLALSQKNQFETTFEFLFLFFKLQTGLTVTPLCCFSGFPAIRTQFFIFRWLPLLAINVKTPIICLQWWFVLLGLCWFFCFMNLLCLCCHVLFIYRFWLAFHQHCQLFLSWRYERNYVHLSWNKCLSWAAATNKQILPWIWLKPNVFIMSFTCTLGFCVVCSCWCIRLTSNFWTFKPGMLNLYQKQHGRLLLFF